MFATSNPPLGDSRIALSRFAGLITLFEEWSEPAFKNLSERKRFETVMRTLLNLILDCPAENFLLAATVEFIALINTHQIFLDRVQFHHWEFWLNQFSGLDASTHAIVRGKLSGKFIPREAFQDFFPIGTGKSYFGSHFVAAHLSPDIDTMIASFWGWVDAFTAKVACSQHHWSLPGGPPNSPITTVFREVFGEQVFSVLARTSSVMTLNAIDLVTQSHLFKEVAPTSINTLDHGFSGKAVLLVDENERFLGDWRTNDVELVRQVIILFKSCLHWFENNLHMCLISFFAKKQVSREAIQELLDRIFSIPIGACEPALEFNQKQLSDLDRFLSQVLSVPGGLKATFSDLIASLKAQGMPALSQVKKILEEMHQEPFFDAEGSLKEARSQIFYFLESIIVQIDHAVHQIRNYVERLDLAVKIKSEVVGIPSPTISLRSDVDEMLAKMKQYDYLTVAVAEPEGKLYPIGVVWASDLRRQSLGTVSFRDFSTAEEVKMAQYLTPISLVDHHKSSFTSPSVPTMVVGDVQSCNVLLAEVSFRINDRYSLGGMTPSAIAGQIKDLKAAAATPENERLLSRLLQKTRALLNRDSYFVHPQREFAEYLFFLYAILDDTDLLTKVTPRDVDCVAELLNRMKSLVLEREVEVVHFDAIAPGPLYAREAARRLLQNDEMYSLYKRIYQYREQELNDYLKNCADVGGESLFSDTKEQSGCCRVGQLKLFSHNFPVYQTVSAYLKSIWTEKAQDIFKGRPEVDLHLQMISTVPSAEEVYQDTVGNYGHLDELWVWIPQTQRAIDHLTTFLYAFQSVPEVEANAVDIVIEGAQAARYQEIFKQNFLNLPMSMKEESPRGATLAILRYRAGALNSRKALISPYLPKLLT